jgi:hypothetical protein
MFLVALALDEAAKASVPWVILHVYDEHCHLLMTEYFRNFDGRPGHSVTLKRFFHFAVIAEVVNIASFWPIQNSSTRRFTR